MFAYLQSDRKKRAAGAYYFGVDQALVSKLQSELVVPDGIEFIETVEINEPDVILTKDGVDVASCNLNGQCTCLNGASRNDNAECEIQDCAKNAVEDSIDDTIDNIDNFLQNDSSLARRRNRKGRLVEYIDKYYLALVPP